MRADWFRFSGLEVADATLRGHYELDGRHFSEEIVFEGVDTLRRPALVAAGAIAPRIAMDLALNAQGLDHWLTQASTA